MNDVVQSFLITADPEIGAGIFPTEEIRNWFFLGVNRARETIVREDELPSPEERERLRRVRIAWADGEPEHAGIHLAFDLPGDVKAADARPAPATALPVAPPPGDPGQRTASLPPSPGQRMDRAQSLYDWESNVMTLPVHEMEDFRTPSMAGSAARLDLGRHLMYADAGMTQFILNRIFPDSSFVIEYASGVRPAAGRLRFDIPQSPAWTALAPGGSLVRRSRPLGLHRTRPQVGVPGRLSLSRLASRIRELSERMRGRGRGALPAGVISDGGARPAAAVVTLRAAALRVLGMLDREDMARVIAALAQTQDDIAASVSPSWQELARPAREIIRSLEVGLIADFAAARQGETGDPIVIDAAALEPAGREAIDDPAAAVARLGEFTEYFSELEQARASLTANWAGAVASERQELLACLQFLRCHRRFRRARYRYLG